MKNKYLIPIIALVVMVGILIFGYFWINLKTAVLTNEPITGILNNTYTNPQRQEFTLKENQIREAVLNDQEIPSDVAYQYNENSGYYVYDSSFLESYIEKEIEDCAAILKAETCTIINPEDIDIKIILNKINELRS